MISCNQKGSVTLRMHQIRFSPGFRLGPRWGAHGAPPESIVGWGEGYFLPISLPVDACGASPWDWGIPPRT